MAFALSIPCPQVVLATKRTTRAGPAKMATVAQANSSLGKQLRNGAAAGALALSLFSQNAFALPSDSEYFKTIQAKEAEEIQMIKDGMGPPVAKNPELSALFSYTAVSVLVVAGVSNFFTNSPTNRLYAAKQAADKKKKAAEKAK